MCHLTVTVWDCFESDNIQYIIWPLSSPDLNPSENVWDDLGWHLAAATAFNKKITICAQEETDRIICRNKSWIMLIASADMLTVASDFRVAISHTNISVSSAFAKFLHNCTATCSDQYLHITPKLNFNTYWT